MLYTIIHVTQIITTTDLALFNFREIMLGDGFMKIGVLGGAGDMGFGIVRFLAEMKEVDKVLIGDINPNRVKDEIKELGEIGEKIELVKVDARDKSSLMDYLSRDLDSVVSAIGPFYEYARPIMEAAIEAGKPFLDICDDYDGAEHSLELNEEAKKKGVTCITGLGWTPGLSNILALKGYRELNGADEIKIYWLGSAADSKGLAVVMHVFHAMTGEIPQYLEGELKMVKAGSEREDVFFPEPFEEHPTYYVGHPEPVTIPRYLEGLKTVILKGALVPNWQNTLVKFFVKLRFTKTPTRKRRLAKFIHSIEDIFRSGGVEASAVRVDVIHGEEKIVFASVDRMFRLTGLPAALGAKYLAKREVEEPGVYPPEALIEPEKLLKELIENDIPLYMLKDNTWKLVYV